MEVVDFTKEEAKQPNKKWIFKYIFSKYIFYKLMTILFQYFLKIEKLSMEPREKDSMPSGKF